ncbi:MAG: hypothetical protein HZA54_16475, partial [Planctomycetes bacterium]|nr:hypothetical protein [Planctomycetota bacterium]
DGQPRRPGQEVEPGWKIQEITEEGVLVVSVTHPARSMMLFLQGNGRGD